MMICGDRSGSVLIYVLPSLRGPDANQPCASEQVVDPDYDGSFQIYLSIIVA
jgi:hypothetical protein